MSVILTAKPGDHLVCVTAFFASPIGLPFDEDVDVKEFRVGDQVTYTGYCRDENDEPGLGWLVTYKDGEVEYDALPEYFVCENVWQELKKHFVQKDDVGLPVSSLDSVAALALHKDVPRLRGASRSVRKMAFSPKDEILAAGCWKGHITLWDAKAYAERSFIPNEGEDRAVSSLSFSSDGDLLVGGGKWYVPEARVRSCGYLKIIDKSSRTKMDLSEHFKTVLCAEWHPRGGLFAVCDEDSVSLWDGDGKQHTRVEMKATCMRFVAGGLYLAVMTSSGEIIYYTTPGLVETSRSYATPAHTFLPTGDGHVVGAGAAGVWRQRVGKPDWVAKDSRVSDLALTPDGDFVLVAGGCVKFLEMNTGRTAIEFLSGHGTMSVAVSHDGDQVVAGDNCGNIHVLGSVKSIRMASRILRYD